MVATSTPKNKEEIKLLDYPLVFLQSNLPASVWEPLSEYLPTSFAGETDSLLGEVTHKWAMLMSWAALYFDTVTSFAQNAPEKLRALDTEKAQAEIFSWVMSAYAFLSSIFVTYVGDFKAKATEYSEQGLGLFQNLKTKATPYWELLDKKFKLQELFASLKLEDLYAQLALCWVLVVKQFKAFLTMAWEESERILAGAMENERVKKLVKQGSDFGQKAWETAKQKSQDNERLHEMTAWLALMYTACSERVAGLMPSE